MKSLDKKKIKYGEPCPECGLSWAHGSVKCSYPYPPEPKDYGSTGQTNQKSLDKKKTKKLDWEKEFDKKLTEIHGRRLPKMVKSFIQSLLSTQRQEIEELWDIVVKHTTLINDLQMKVNSLSKQK